MLSLMSPYVHHQTVRMVEANGRQLRVRHERRLRATERNKKTNIQVLHIFTLTSMGCYQFCTEDGVLAS